MLPGVTVALFTIWIGMAESAGNASSTTPTTTITPPTSKTPTSMTVLTPFTSTSSTLATRATTTITNPTSASTKAKISTTRGQPRVETTLSVLKNHSTVAPTTTSTNARTLITTGDQPRLETTSSVVEGHSTVAPTTTSTNVSVLMTTGDQPRVETTLSTLATHSTDIITSAPSSAAGYLSTAAAAVSRTAELTTVSGVTSATSLVVLPAAETTSSKAKDSFTTAENHATTMPADSFVSSMPNIADRTTYSPAKQTGPGTIDDVTHFATSAVGDTSMASTMAPPESSVPATSRSNQEDISKPAFVPNTTFHEESAAATSRPRHEHSTVKIANPTTQPSSSRNISETATNTTQEAAAKLSDYAVIGVITCMIVVLVVVIALAFITRYRAARKARREPDIEEVPLNRLNQLPEAGIRPKVVISQSDKSSPTPSAGQSNKSGNTSPSDESPHEETNVGDVTLQPLIGSANMNQTAGDVPNQEVLATPTSQQDAVYSTVAVGSDGAKSTVQLNKPAMSDVEL